MDRVALMSSAACAFLGIVYAHNPWDVSAVRGRGYPSYRVEGVVCAREA